MGIIQDLITEQVIGALFSVAIGILGFVCGVLVKRAKKAREEEAAMRAGFVSLLRTHIIQECDKCTERGYVHLHNLDNVHDMYATYHSLGGNGTVTKMVDDLMELPIR